MIWSDDSVAYRLVYQRRTRRTGFDYWSHNQKMKMSPDFIIDQRFYASCPHSIADFFIAVYNDNNLNALMHKCETLVKTIR